MYQLTPIWGFDKIRGTFLGDPYDEGCSTLGSILGAPDLGKLPYTAISMLGWKVNSASQASSIHCMFLLGSGFAGLVLPKFSV